LTNTLTMINLDTLRDRLDNMLNQETADSLNQWLNNKRDMDEKVMARIELVGVLDDIQSMMHELTLSELDELIDELTHLYERYNVYAQSRNGDKPE
jgi:DNA topoisomerase VI subunit B